MKQTLLEMVQGILSDMDGDEVTSYDETTESLQVANIIRETYYVVLARSDVPEHYGVYQLTAGGSSFPTQLTLPSTAQTLDVLKYDCRLSGATYPQFEDMQFMNLTDFLDRMYQLPQDSDSTIETFTKSINGSTFTFYVHNDRAPSVYTTIDDNICILDSYDEAIDASGLTAAKTVAYGKQLPTFTLSNSFTPTLDANLFPLFFQEAKAQCFAELRQMTNEKAEKRSRQLWAKQMDSRYNVGGVPRYPNQPHNPNNYGRRGQR